jgi:hypothetical protein
VEVSPVTEKPKPQFTMFTRREGRYDLLHPDVVFAQYVFRWALGEEPALKRSFLVSEGHDWNARPTHGTALELACDLVAHYEEAYLYTGQLAKAQAVVKYLEAREEVEELARLEYDIAHAKYMIEHWQKELTAALARRGD